MHVDSRTISVAFAPLLKLSVRVTLIEKLLTARLTLKDLHIPSRFPLNDIKVYFTDPPHVLLLFRRWRFKTILVWIDNTKYTSSCGYRSEGGYEDNDDDGT